MLCFVMCELKTYSLYTPHLAHIAKLCDCFSIRKNIGPADVWTQINLLK